MTQHLLYKTEIPVTDRISIRIPTVRDVMADEDHYYSLVTMLTAMPYDLMGWLDEVGIDFTEIDEYQLFLIIMQGLIRDDVHLIFGDLDFSRFELAVNEEMDMPVYVDRENEIVIDRVVQQKIASTLRSIHHMKKNHRKPGNEEAKKYLLEQERKKRKRRKRSRGSQLESLIVSMVNTEQFKYDYTSVLDLTIYQFNESVRQILRKVDYDHRMTGVYAGTVDAKKLSQKDLTWLYSD